MRQRRYQLSSKPLLSYFSSSTFNVAYIKIPASIIITIILILTRIGTIACARNTVIAAMSIRAITAIIMAPITLLGALGVPN
jgi:hypothetical protein